MNVADVYDNADDFLGTEITLNTKLYGNYRNVQIDYSYRLKDNKESKSYVQIPITAGMSYVITHTTIENVTAHRRHEDELAYIGNIEATGMLTKKADEYILATPSVFDIKLEYPPKLQDLLHRKFYTVNLIFVYSPKSRRYFDVVHARTDLPIISPQSSAIEVDSLEMIHKYVDQIVAISTGRIGTGLYRGGLNFNYRNKVQRIQLKQADLISHLLGSTFEALRPSGFIGTFTFIGRLKLSPTDSQLILTDIQHITCLNNL